MRKAQFVSAICISALLAGAAWAQPAAKTGTPVKPSRFPLTAGSEWTYQVEFSVQTPLWYDPYFIQPPLLSTSISHGTTAKLRDQGPGASFVVKIVGSESPAIARIEVSEEGLHHWFSPVVENPKLVVSASTDTLPGNHPWMKKCEETKGEWKPLLPFAQPLEALEIRATMQMKDPKEPWILGQILAMVPADGKSRVEKCGWLVEKSSRPVTVPAGTYATVFHSRIPRGDGTATPPHTVESWVAPGVGLVKSTVLDSEDKPRYSILLKSVTIR